MNYKMLVENFVLFKILNGWGLKCVLENKQNNCKSEQLEVMWETTIDVNSMSNMQIKTFSLIEKMMNYV